MPVLSPTKFVYEISINFVEYSYRTVEYCVGTLIKVVVFAHLVHTQNLQSNSVSSSPPWKKKQNKINETGGRIVRGDKSASTFLNMNRERRICGGRLERRVIKDWVEKQYPGKYYAAL